MENRIKERLTGALILVAALVILVPEIFSGRRPSEPARGAPAAPPASEGPPLRSYTTEVDATQPPPIESPSVAAAAPATPVPVPSPVTAPEPEAKPPSTPPAAAPVQPPPPEKPAPVARPAASDRPSPVKPAPATSDKPSPAKPPPAAAPAAGDWFVQVGSFSQAENAERYAQQLRKQGFTPVVLPPAGARGLLRVRVGPVRSREAAAALLDKLAASGHKGAVVGS